ncbi:Tetrathionate reductase two-component response regulator [Klebsiella michiganensis]|uniref:Tetrathionate reductase two-component response regulator n=1 Tax=Klebsiella michiganensis TaxID=1134687 RepID=A0A7H4MZ87_9ENTR|nr:Tetrathionate reductase two-component response regulator [Klebsiella michiganensis]
MPALDGQAVHEALRQRGSTLAVVFLTGHGDVPMAVEQMKRGAVDFLQKPVSVKPLQTALERGLAASGERFARQKNVDCYQQLTPKERGACAAGGERADESGDCGDNEHCRTHGGGPSGEGDGKDAGGESGGVSQHLTAGYRVILMIPMNEAWRAPGGNKKRRLISEHKNW